MSKSFDPTKPVTWDGRPARIICTDAGGNLPLVFLYKLEGSCHETLMRARADGTTAYSFAPLVNAPERTSKFRAVYKDGSMYASLLTKEAPHGDIWPGRGAGWLEYVYEDDELVDVKFHKKEEAE